MINWFAENWEACSLPSTLRAVHVLSSLYMMGLFVRPQTQKERDLARFTAAVCGENVAQRSSMRLGGTSTSSSFFCSKTPRPSNRFSYALTQISKSSFWSLSWAFWRAADELLNCNLCSILKLVYFDSWSWQPFVSTYDVFKCLFPLDVQNWIQLLSRVICYSWLVCLLGFWLRNAPLVKVGNPISDGMTLLVA